MAYHLKGEYAEVIQESAHECNGEVGHKAFESGVTLLRLPMCPALQSKPTLQFGMFNDDHL
jgi:hypothetical protein